MEQLWAQVSSRARTASPRHRLTWDEGRNSVASKAYILRNTVVALNFWLFPLRIWNRDVLCLIANQRPPQNGNILDQVSKSLLKLKIPKIDWCGLGEVKAPTTWKLSTSKHLKLLDNSKHDQLWLSHAGPFGFLPGNHPIQAKPHAEWRSQRRSCECQVTQRCEEAEVCFHWIPLWWCWNSQASGMSEIPKHVRMTVRFV